MLSTFNLDKLRLLLKDFYTLTKIRITVFSDSFQELVAYPEYLTSFCQLIRTNQEAEKRCIQCDREACATVLKSHSSYIYKCHSGLTEAIAPVFLNNMIIGYLFFGQVFCYPTHEEGWRSIKECCKSYNIDMSLLEEVSLGLPIIPEEYIVSASNLLNAVAVYLGMEQMVIMQQQDLSVQIDDYINSHLTEPIGVKDICTRFHIGKTHLYEISQKIFGIGIIEHIRNLRIKKAKTLLLENPEIHVKEVCYSCGFDNYDYFITRFKRITGLSPTQFRNVERKNYTEKRSVGKL
jgi:AraC-like DNA-binding protein